MRLPNTFCTACILTLAVWARGTISLKSTSMSFFICQFNKFTSISLYPLLDQQAIKIVTEIFVNFTVVLLSNTMYNSTAKSFYFKNFFISCLPTKGNKYTLSGFKAFHFIYFPLVFTWKFF